ncbi:MAG TPA: trypsin-like peptidase domain-containing protein [Candidatus Dormibacteraeota bacterium]
MGTIARDRGALAGIRSEVRIRPAAPGRRRLRDLPGWTVVAAAAVMLMVAAPVAGLGWALHAMGSQRQSVEGLRAEVQTLQAKVDAQPDWTSIARNAEPSVFTIETDYGLGSGWVARAGAGGSEVVTNFHVIADAWSAGVVTVDVRQGDRSLKGTIARVDPNDDLAVIHVGQILPVLLTAPGRPVLAQAVMVIGSPLGLGGSVSAGVISGFRSLEGSDYVQFSAPISPGNSGGPVVDARGRVVAVASAKFEGSGIEALSLGIPVQTACSALVACSLSPD